MPLIDLRTDLKSLKFGHDRVDGGSSNRPYEISPIPEDDKQGIPNISDFLLRGGLSAPLRAAKDVSRLTKMFLDTKTPSGIQFTIKENLLSRTSVKTEASTTAGSVYTPLSTLGTAATGFLGVGLNLLGLDPTGLSSLGIQKYYDYIKEEVIGVNGDEGDEKNRLIALADPSTKRRQKLGKKIKLFPKGNDGISTFMQYGGGAGSVLGIGKTKWEFTTNPTPDSNKRTWDISTSNNINTFTLDRDEMYNMDVYKIGGPISQVEIKDFREIIISNNQQTSNLKKSISKSPQYTKYNIESNEGAALGNPGKPKDVFIYSGGKDFKDAVDKINASPIYSGTSPSYVINGEKRKDLANFSIGILKNDNSGESEYMNFRSYIDSFSDSYTANWGNTQYIGRADKFYNYQGFERSISTAFTVFAQSKAEMEPMYEKLNFLASSLAPSYSSGGFMQGNLVYLTLGNYIYNQLGIIKSLTYTIPQESTWEIGIDENGKIVDKVLPFMIKVTGLNFTPIQSFLPQKSGGAFISQGEFN